MKIWYQTTSSYRYDPLYDEYGKTLEEQCKRAVRPDTEVYVTGSPVSMGEIDKYKYLMYYHKAQVFNNMLRAEKEGYDAFVIGCSLDVGLEEGREMLSIPVLGVTQTSLYFAAMLGERFAMITHQNYISEAYRQLINRYGLLHKYLPTDYYLDISHEDMARALNNPKPIVKKFKSLAERAIADGASIILPGTPFITSLFYVTGELGNYKDTLIMDTVGVLVKAAETLADLKKIGVEASRKPQVYGSPGRELLKKSLKKYTPVFKIEY